MKDFFIRFAIVFMETLKCIFLGLFITAIIIGLILLVPIAIAILVMILPICLIYIIKFLIDDNHYGEGESEEY
jgi:hypothetical protein